MNTAILRRLVWKEYRAQRGFWLGVAGLAFFSQLLVLFLVDRPTETQTTALFSIAFIAPTFFALGCGAAAFAAELEEGTWQRLRILSVSPRWLFASKLGSALFGIVLMLGLLCLFAWSMAAGSPRLSDSEMRTWGLLTLKFLAWGIFFSLVNRKVLNAAWMAPIVVLATVTSGEVRWDVLLIVFAVDYWLARRWLTGELPVRSWFEALTPASTRRTDFQSVPESKNLYVTTEFDTDTGWRRPVKRMLWQEWRQGRQFLAMFTGIGLVLLAISAPARHFIAADFALMLIPLTPLLFGVWVFRGEQEERHYRFLSARGVAPSAVWLSKHLVWLSLTVLVIALFLFVDSFAKHLWSQWMDFSRFDQPVSLLTGLAESLRAPSGWIGPQAALPIFVCNAVLAYTAGQFVSMLIPRAVTAAFVGVVLSFVLAGWLFLMMWLGVPLWWSVGAIPLILMFATFLRTSDWLLERNGWRAWLRVATGVFVPLALLGAGLAVHRVLQIPAVPSSITLDVSLEPVAAEALETAQLYRQAFASVTALPQAAFTSGDLGSDTASPKFGWDQATPAARQWLEKNRNQLEQVLEASKRDSCVFVPAVSQQHLYEPLVHSRRLLLLLMFSARKLEAEDRPDEALERYVAALRLGKHVANRGRVSYQWSLGRGIQRDVFEWMRAWAGHPRQTPERLKRAIRLLDQETADFPPITLALRIERLAVRHRFTEEWGELVGFHPESVFLAFVSRVFLWERARALRLLDALAAEQLNFVTNLAERLARRGADLTVWRSEIVVTNGYPSGGPSIRWTDTTPLLSNAGALEPTMRDRILRETVSWEMHRRALSLRLALVAYRYEHGRLPDRLDKLVGPYFAELPLDPWSGREFGYEPAGLSAPFRFHHAVEPNQPFLWSTGPFNARLIPIGQAEDGRARYDFVSEDGGFIRYFSGEEQYPWSLVIFPIPKSH